MDQTRQVCLPNPAQRNSELKADSFTAQLECHEASFAHRELQYQLQSSC